MGIQKYVCGLMFNDDLSKVALVLKNRPDWQARKWNGIGGHVEPGETFREAMVREFQEEAGILTTLGQWVPIGIFRDDESEVQFYAASDNAVNRVRTMTDERVAVFETDFVMDPRSMIVTVPNIPALIGAAYSCFAYNAKPITLHS